MAGDQSPETSLIQEADQETMQSEVTVRPEQAEAVLNAVLDRMDRNWYRHRDPYCCHFR